jgi:hypothetical protein
LNATVYGKSIKRKQVMMHLMARMVLLPLPTGYHFTRIGPFRGTQPQTSYKGNPISFDVPTDVPSDENYGEGDTLVAVIGMGCANGGAYVQGLSSVANPKAQWVRDVSMYYSFAGGGNFAGVEIWHASNVLKSDTITVTVAPYEYLGQGAVTLLGAVADICGYNLLLGPFNGGNILDRTAQNTCWNVPPTSADGTLTGAVSTSKPGMELWVGGITHLGNDRQSVSTVPGVTNGFNLLDGAPAFGEMSVGYLDKINVDYNGWHGPFPVASSGVHVNPNWYVGCIATYSPLSTYLP